MKLNVIILIGMALFLTGCQGDNSKNLAPIVEDQVFTVAYNQVTEFSILAKDPENEVPSFSLGAINHQGNLVHLGGSKFSFEPNLGQYENVSFEVIVSDSVLSTRSQIELIIEDDNVFEILSSVNSYEHTPIVIDAIISFEFNSIISKSINLNQNSVKTTGSFKLQHTLSG